MTSPSHLPTSTSIYIYICIYFCLGLFRFSLFEPKREPASVERNN